MTREEAIKMLKSKMDGHTDSSYEWAETVRVAIKALEQEPSITWVTGADGAKIAFWDVPVWKVTKICEILVEPQESEE